MTTGAATVVVDGEVVHARDAIPALDRGFLLGDAAFEVLRAYDGLPFMRDAHLERLAASLARLGFAQAPSRDVLEADVALGLERSALRDAYVRVVVTRGDGLGLVPGSGAPRRVVIVAPLSIPDVYARGVGAVVAPSPFDAGAMRSGGAKTASYVEHVIATQAARAEGATEAIFMAPSGQVLEGASSNVFAVCDGVLRTPRLSTGILPGITRRVVLALAERAEIPCLEALVTLVDLRRASEILLTSSVREIVPVTRLDGRPVGAGTPGATYQALRRLYREEVARAGRPGD